MSHRKIHCAIPKCRRWKWEQTVHSQWGAGTHSFICAEHWRLATKAERLLWRRIRRQGRKYGWAAVAERADRVWNSLIRRISEG